MNVNKAEEKPVALPRESAIWEALRTVTDPELPVINIVELGLIADVRAQGADVTVDITPTFAGCPALEVIRTEIRRAVIEAGEENVTVNTVYDPPWTTERMTDEARRKLKEIGLAPPGKRCGSAQMPTLDNIPCPYCDSTNTVMESPFGPTLCRSIHYCNACLQSFEHFKTV